MQTRALNSPFIYMAEYFKGRGKETGKRTLGPLFVGFTAADFYARRVHWLACLKEIQEIPFLTKLPPAEHAVNRDQLIERRKATIINSLRKGEFNGRYNDLLLAFAVWLEHKDISQSRFLDDLIENIGNYEAWDKVQHCVFDYALQRWNADGSERVVKYPDGEINTLLLALHMYGHYIQHNSSFPTVNEVIEIEVKNFMHSQGYKLPDDVAATIQAEFAKFNKPSLLLG